MVKSCLIVTELALHHAVIKRGRVSAATEDKLQLSHWENVGLFISTKSPWINEKYRHTLYLADY